LAQRSGKERLVMPEFGVFAFYRLIGDKGERKYQLAAEK